MKNCLNLVFFLLCFVVAQVGVSQAQQIERPDSDRLFEEDDQDFRDKQSKEIKKLIRADKARTDDIAFKAPSVEYFQEKNEMHGTGGVLISSPDFQVQADAAQMNTETNDAQLQGGILISGVDASISAETGIVNVETETGTFKNAELELEDGAYQVFSADVNKLSEKKYSLYGSSLTTCRCSDGDRPWNIHTSTANVTQEGYAHTYNTWIDFHGVPIFYAPYFAFPIKQERTSGLLVPTWGYSSEDGMLFKQPLFLALNESTDMTLSPFIETNTRWGSAVELRKVFSRRSNVETRWYYSNESQRDGDLRGTDVSGLFDPTIDEDRAGGFLTGVWQNSPDATIPTSLIADVHYVSDDLFARELDDEDVLERTDRYATSVLALRSTLGGVATAEVYGEYSQAIETDDDLVLQRLPEASISGLKSFRPFGFNPYGLKVVGKMNAGLTEFSRDQGYDGGRYNLNPSVKVPFHYKNYFNSEFTAGYNQTEYQMDDLTDPDGGADLEDSNSRGIYNLEYRASSGVERVYELPQENWLTYLTSLGADNQQDRLRRLKHTIEPTVKYAYVPNEDQEDLPLYDSFDRIKERSVVTYGVVSRLYGRFSPKQGGAAPITELTPRLEDVPTLTGAAPIADFGEASFGYDLGDVKVREGEIREIANITLKQSYDFLEAREDNDPDREELSDAGVDIGLFPSKNFGLKFESNLNVEDTDFSSWAISTRFRDDRGDSLIARYSYITDSISQIDGNLEIKLSERFRFGLYGRFDDRESEFLENRGAIRFVSSCNCWMLDLGYDEELNPDRKKMMLRLTFTGLGDLAQGFGYGQQQ